MQQEVYALLRQKICTSMHEPQNLKHFKSVLNVLHVLVTCGFLVFRKHLELVVNQLLDQHVG
jgi:hypothetical protein